MAEIRKINEHYKELAEQLINSESELNFIKSMGIKIVYLESDDEKKSNGKAVLGQCEKIANKNKWAIPYDFSITVFTPNIEGFDDNKLKIVLHHELLHIGFPNGILGCVPHDVDEFQKIIEKYGFNWQEV